MNKIKRFLNFGLKYRYIIALIILVVCTFFKISGSSVGIYDFIIQPNNNSNDITIGYPKGIRSDEWVYEIINVFSQKQNNFNSINNHFNATDTFVRYPDNSLITKITKPYFIGMYFLDFERAYAFLWWVRCLFLVLVTIEFLLILTEKDKKWTLVGTLIIAFSPAIYWWYSSCILELFAFAMLITVLLDKYLKSKKIYSRLLLGLLFSWAGACFTIHLYPAIQVPLGYSIVVLAIFIIIKNYKEGFKFQKKDLLIVIGIILLYIGLVGSEIYVTYNNLKNMMATKYPGQRNSSGGNGLMTLFGYVYDMWLPYKSEIQLNCETANFYSLFPIPTIIALLYYIKNKKNKEFYIPMLVISAFLSIYTILGFGDFISNITLMSYSIGARSAIVLGFITTIIMIYMCSHIKEEQFIKKYKLLVLISTNLLIIILAFKTMLCSNLDNEVIVLLVFSVILLIGSSICFISYRKVLIDFLVFISIISVIFINPIQIGTSVLTEKPIAKKVQEINRDNQVNNIWLIDDGEYGIILNNYFIASDAKVINSLMIYPNMEFWKNVLDEEFYNTEKEEIYNRYANIVVTLEKDEKTEIKLKSKDCIILNLNVNKLKDINVHYVISKRDLNDLDNEIIDFVEIYNEDNMRIYEVKY